MAWIRQLVLVEPHVLDERLLDPATQRATP
jgi:hypothetical protein